VQGGGVSIVSGGTLGASAASAGLAASTAKTAIALIIATSDKGIVIEPPANRKGAPAAACRSSGRT
jgi:hypothetical protein